MLQNSDMYVSLRKTNCFGRLLVNTRCKNCFKTLPKLFLKEVRVQIALSSSKGFPNDPHKLSNRSHFVFIFCRFLRFFFSNSMWGPKASPGTLQTAKMTKNGAPGPQNCSKNDVKLSCSWNGTSWCHFNRINRSKRQWGHLLKKARRPLETATHVILTWPPG